MEKLRLVKNGVFPITFDEQGKKIKQFPETGMDIPGTIQGEGKLAGVPVLFVRTAACNLRCAWKLPDGSSSICDTPFSSFDIRDSVYLPVDEVAALILANLSNLKHLVISGGEPFLQGKALSELCALLKNKKPDLHITIETNATLWHDKLVNHIDFFSLSPKLASSVPDRDKIQDSSFRIMDNYSLLHNNRRINIKIINRFIKYSKSEGKDFQLKFVFSGSVDEPEIKEILSKLPLVKAADVLLMPLGTSEKELNEGSNLAIRTCIKNGWRFCPRLHIELFGHKEGV